MRGDSIFRAVSRRIVITCLGSYGDVYPYIGLARALRAGGHRPVVATSASYRPAVEQEGLEFEPLGPDVDLRDEAALKRVMDARTGGEVVVKEFVLPALEQTYEETLRLAAGADVLVSHPLTFCTPVVGADRRLPWVGTILAPMSLFSDGDFPVLPALPGAAGLMRKWPWLRRRLMALVRRETAKWTRPLADLRARHGLPPGGNPLIEGQYSPHLNLGLFSRVMAAAAAGLAGADADDRVRLLQRAGSTAPPSSRRFSTRGRRRWCSRSARRRWGPRAASITRARRRRRGWACARCC